MTIDADKQRLRAVIRAARDSIADSDQRSARKQITNQVPMSRTDVAIDFVITEQRLVDCRARS